MAENTKAAANTKPAKKSFFKGVKSEWKKITWPTKDSLIKETGAVVIISILLGAIIALLDAGIGELLRLLPFAG